MNPLDVSGIRTLLRRAVADAFGHFKKSLRRININADAIADILVQSIPSHSACVIPPMVEEVVAPLKKMMLDEPEAWRKLKTLDVVVEGAPPLDVSEVSKNLHMRKRLAFGVALARTGPKAVLAISARGYSLLPAVTDGLIRVTPPQASDSFDRLVGIEAPLSYAKRWEGFFAGQSAFKPESLLLVGPPGCGKTSFVRAFAAYLKKPYVILRSKDIESAETLLTAFATMRKYARDGLVVCIDEIDGIAGDRADKSEGYIERLNLLLQQIDGFEVDPEAKIMYIGATNRISTLDNAIMRAGRFGQTVVFAPLDGPARRALVKLAAEECKTAIDGELEDFIVETTTGLVPATIKAVIREMAAVSGTQSPSKQIFLRARHVVLEGLFTQQTSLNDAEIHSVAAHEAGHALCCLQNGIGVIQASIVSSGDALGFIEQKNSGMSSHTKTGLLASIDIALAGRAAQEVLGGQPTDGAINDIERASGLAMQYVKSGFSEYGIGIPPEGLAWQEISPIVRKLLESRYARVKQQLSREKAALRRLADLLVERKVVCQEELQACRTKKERQVCHD